MRLEAGLVFDRGDQQSVALDRDPPQRRAASERVQAAHQLVVPNEELRQRRTASERLEAARELVACKCANN